MDHATSDSRPAACPGSAVDIQRPSSRLETGPPASLTWRDGGRPLPDGRGDALGAARKLPFADLWPCEVQDGRFDIDHEAAVAPRADGQPCSGEARPFPHPDEAKAVRRQER